MLDLIEALEIFLKYDDEAQTHCEHDVLMVVGGGLVNVSQGDKDLLDKLGFREGEYGFESYRHGSA